MTEILVEMECGHRTYARSDGDYVGMYCEICDKVFDYKLVK